MAGNRRLNASKIARLATFTLLSFLLSQANAPANQLVFNGNFETDISKWAITPIEKGMIVKWDKAGNNDPGSIKLSATGRMQDGENSIIQALPTQITAGSKATLSVSWKKNWSSMLPDKQYVRIGFIKPDASVVAVWANQKLANNNEWKTETVDVSRYLDQTGKYSIKIDGVIANGNSRDADTAIWLDNIKLDVQSNISNAPRTSILSPTGSSHLAGGSTIISGIATGENEIKFVEISIERYDHAWWNGESWVRNQFWNRTKISNGKGTNSVTWSYPWQLPTSDGARFIIRARTTDIVGNQEELPIECPILIDNVASIGNILINNGAEATCNQQVTVKNVVRGAVQMQYSIDEGHTWSTWRRFTSLASVIIPKGDGMKTVSAQFQDAGGNIFKTSDTILLDTVPPVARSLFPVENATNMATSIKVGVVFYEDMDPASFTNNGSPLGSTVYLTQGSRWVPAYAIYNPATKSLRLSPTMQLDPGSNYMVHLTRGIKDVAGNPLAAEFTWKFSTAGNFVPIRTTSIGSNGGNILSRNEIATLAIPRGALDIDTNITMEELRDKDIPDMHNAIRYSPVYRLTPADLSFNKQASIKIRYEQNQVPDPTNLIIAYYDDKEKAWKPFAHATINLVDHQIVAPMTGLGTVTVLSQTDPEPPATSIIEPTGLRPIQGNTVRIYGVATDNVGVAGVEITIVRKSNDTYWDGKNWTEEETWLPMKIVDGSNGRKASWFFAWKMPAGLRDDYKIVARSRDVNGNIGASAGPANIALANSEF